MVVVIDICCNVAVFAVAFLLLLELNDVIASMICLAVLVFFLTGRTMSKEIEGLQSPHLEERPAYVLF